MHHASQSGSRLQNLTSPTSHPPLPQATNLAGLSSLPFWVGGCHGNPLGSSGFLSDWPGLENHFGIDSAVFVGNFNERAAWPTFSAAQWKWQGREVLLNWKGQRLPERWTTWEMSREAEQCPCPLLLPHLRGEGLPVTSGVILQHGAVRAFQAT